MVLWVSRVGSLSIRKASVQKQGGSKLVWEILSGVLLVIHGVIRSSRKTVVQKQPSKKDLISTIKEQSGKSFAELDSLARTNKETLQWIVELTS